ncbi:chorismate synthase [Malassezia yamatoensis]|uniref:chorismate synthase n=1 Tax=Malassezia yamatoensis TaxID=253288 RepID=A0AAJ5YRT3_9BASI|nr:chorismate synthase [Malassezia yamatoensis]
MAFHLRDEKDKVEILSGTERNVTLGTPVAMLVRNQDHRPHDYTDDTLDRFPRPSHADYTYLEKYNVKASSGGGRSSARETIGRVAAGALAEKYLKEAFNTEIVAFVSSVGQVHVPQYPTKSPSQDLDDSELPMSEEFLNMLNTVTRQDVDKEDIRCPQPEVAELMRKRIMAAKSKNDSIGGTVTCVLRNMPVGLGEPCFDKLEAMLAHAMMSIPATKGFEIGSGFRGTQVPGSLHNDPFVVKPDGTLGTKTNWSGGIQGGISNGENIYFRVAFKPPATISQEQQTTQYDGKAGVLSTRGRHDPCVVPRAISIVESMAAITLMDAVLAQDARAKAANRLDPAAISALPRSMKKHDHS